MFRSRSNKMADNSSSSRIDPPPKIEPRSADVTMHMGAEMEKGEMPVTHREPRWDQPWTEADLLRKVRKLEGQIQKKQQASPTAPTPKTKSNPTAETGVPPIPTDLISSPRSATTSEAGCSSQVTSGTKSSTQNSKEERKRITLHLDGGV
jgi:hypothetical protein